jgi:hypothetical protein
VNQPGEDPELQKFIDSTRPEGPSSAELADLNQYVQRNPPRRGLDTYTTVGIGFFVIIAIRILFAVLSS